eukprot:1994944-Pleurochrysis_carterae.AAC.1
MGRAMGGAVFNSLLVARASADVGASSLAQRARPAPSVENAMSAPAPQKSEFRADSSRADGVASVAAASATLAAMAEAFLSGEALAL